MSWDPWPRPVRDRPWGQRSVHRLAKMTSRSRFGAFVYTVAPLRTDMGAQECTQIGENGLSVLFWGIRVHCCAVADRRGDAGVYTDRRKWTLDAVLGHSCTLLRRDSPRRQPTLTPEEPYDISLFIGANTLDVSLIACCLGSTMLYATVGSATHNVPSRPVGWGPQSIARTSTWLMIASRSAGSYSPVFGDIAAADATAME